MKNYYLLIVLMTVLAMPASAQPVQNAVDIFLHISTDFQLPDILKRASRDRLKVDFDGDGTPEIATVTEDENGYTTAIKIFDPPAREPVYELLQFEIQFLFGQARVRVLGLVNGGTDAAALILLTQVPDDLNAEIINLGITVLSMNTNGVESKIISFPAEEDSGKQSNTEIKELTDFLLFDFNGDGELDIVVQDQEAGRVEIWTIAENTSVSNEALGATLTLALSGAYPNPATGLVTIPYTVPESSAVVLQVYDMLGREVRMLVDQTQHAGTHTAAWDGTDAAGQRVAAGVYVYQLRVGDQTESQTLIRID